MKNKDYAALFQGLRTPAYVVDEDLLRANLETLAAVQADTGCRILLALKGFSMHAVFPLVGRHLAGITASSLHEARLGREEMDREVHIYAPAYRDDEFDQILGLCDHIVFNSPSQVRRFLPRVEAARRNGRTIECGLRINPEYSEIEVPLYDPCYLHSRLGTTRVNLSSEDLAGLDGLHFHSLCEQNADALAHTLDAVEAGFGDLLGGLKWLNFGGGHHITRPDYDGDLLRASIRRMQDRYGLQVILEPGEAIALNTGFLATRVLDVVDNGMPVAILDTSAACHMPDVLEMPYRPEIIGAAKPGEKAHTVRLGGPTCLAGDVIGDYSFDAPLEPGDLLIFTDMAHYTMVKNNTFNGINLPDIVLLRGEEATLLARFGYEDFRSRLS